MTPTIEIYKQEADIPKVLHQQILDFLRIVWNDGFTEKNLFRTWICRKEFNPVFFLLTSQNILISHLCVVHQQLTHANESFNTYGLSGVFTYPQFRKQGYGLQLVRAATDFIQNTNADIALFTTTTHNFYEKAGYIRMEQTRLLHGDKSNPQLYPEEIYMQFISAKGKQHKNSFDKATMYIGEHVW